MDMKIYDNYIYKKNQCDAAWQALKPKHKIC